MTRHFFSWVPWMAIQGCWGRMLLLQAEEGHLSCWDWSLNQTFLQPQRTSLHNLACKIRQEREIQGITIFQQEFKLSRIADDTTLLVCNFNSVRRAFFASINLVTYLDWDLTPPKAGPYYVVEKNPLDLKWADERNEGLGTLVSFNEKHIENICPILFAHFDGEKGQN